MFIKTLKDLNLTTTNESGKVTEPINKLITFLIMRAINEMEDKDKKRMTVSTNFDKTKYQNEQVQEINQQANPTNFNQQ